MNIYSPVKGKVKDLKYSSDKVFSEYMMGVGFFVESSDSIISSPINGKVSFVADTKHAIVIENNETNVMVHVGLDTCALKGEPFEILVNEGDEVKAGDTLMNVNHTIIKNNSLNDDVLVIIVSNKDESLLKNLPDSVHKNDLVMEV